MYLLQLKLTAKLFNLTQDASDNIYDTMKAYIHEAHKEALE